MGFGLRVRVRVRVHVVWRLPRQANSRGHLLRVRVGLGFTLRITLDPDTPLGDITSMLRTWDAKRFNAYPISPAIRDPRRNGSDLLEPVGQRIWPEFTHEIHSTVEVFGMGESQSRSRRAGS